MLHGLLNTMKRERRCPHLSCAGNLCNIAAVPVSHRHQLPRKGGERCVHPPRQPAPCCGTNQQVTAPRLPSASLHCRALREHPQSGACWTARFSWHARGQAQGWASKSPGPVLRWQFLLLLALGLPTGRTLNSRLLPRFASIASMPFLPPSRDGEGKEGINLSL